jgi:chaperone required for assembly of F1-ATPase
VKRFWSKTEAVASERGWAIELDGKPLRTPGREALKVPTAALAEAIVAEWASVGDRVEPREMPLTGFANAAIDRVAPERAAFAAALGRYADGDLACYRAAAPRELVARQSASWDSLLAWGRRRFDVDFRTTSGIVHVPQPPATVERLAHAVAALDPFQLAGLSPLVTIGGSLLAALAIVERGLTVEQAWAAVTVDETWQLEQWGSDAEAERALENRRRDFFAAARFLQLLES